MNEEHVIESTHKQTKKVAIGVFDFMQKKNITTKWIIDTFIYLFIFEYQSKVW